MRTLLLVYILTFTSFCFGQNLEFVENETESFYKVIEDSLELKRNYPDGRYKVFLTDTNNLPVYVFHLRKDMVDGSYLKLTTTGWTYGSYSQDSLWTFLTNPKDTTFKVGTWRQSAVGLTIEDVYKMPYNNNDEFKEVWRFHNGNIAREAIFKKSFGLKKETYWDFETNKISKQTINSGTKNYYQSITYENDSISYVSLVQNGFEVVIDFNYMPYFCEKIPCMQVAVYSDNSERKDLPMTAIAIDSTNTLTRFDDIKRQIFLSEAEDGNVKVRYQNRKGKEKYKKLKIK